MSSETIPDKELYSIVSVFSVNLDFTRIRYLTTINHFQLSSLTRTILSK